MRAGLRVASSLSAAVAVTAAGSTCIVSIADLEPVTSSGASGGAAGAGGSTGTGGQGGVGGNDPCAAYVDLIVSDGPIGYWRLDEPDGAESAHDELGTYDGTYEGIVSLGEPGALACGTNTAARFGPSDGHVEITDEPFDFALKAPYSFEVWVKPVDAPGDITVTQAVISKDNWQDDIGSGNPRGHTMRFVDTGSLIYQRQWALDDSTTLTAGELPNDAFTHIVVTYDASDRRVRMYVDGQVTGDGQPSDIDLLDHDEPLTFGRASNGARQLNGWIDEVAVYDYALSAAQVLSHCEAGRGAECP